MYHEPKMCRTCLQMSRGDFKFVSLDSVDPLWESNSPNLKAQLMSLVPEMKIDNTNTFICTACFIALRTAYEFKRMCQSTEQKFQNHNYKYRRPFGVGPGSPQFHVTLNENRPAPPQLQPINNNNNIFHSQKLNYLQADTSIDITEHHLYDASRSVPRRIHYVNSGKVAEPGKVLKAQDSNVPKKPLNSQELKEKFNLGSQISILKTEREKARRRPVAKTDPDENLNKMGEKEVPCRKEALRCRVRLEAMTHRFVRDGTGDSYADLDEIKGVSHAYYFGKLEVPVACDVCAKSFARRNLLQMHRLEEHGKAESVGRVRKLGERRPVPFRCRNYAKCCICFKTCVSRIQLVRHLNYLHVPGTRKRRILPKRTIVPDDEEPPFFLRQLRVRTGHPFASSFRCSICDKGFVNENELDVHMYVHTPVILSMDETNDQKDDDSECLFTCYLCGKSFLKERFLKLHNIQMHLRNKLTTCKNCGRQFKSEFWYERHKCVVPPEETPAQEVADDSNMFPCNFCERKFSQLRFMKVHRRRSHKFLLASRYPKDKSTEPPVLDGTKEADPMELYSIAGTSSFADEATPEGEGDSDSETFSEAEDPMDSAITGDFLDATEPRIEIKTEPFSAPIEAPEFYQAARRGRPPLHPTNPGIVRPPTDAEENSRRGNRTLPKIQCDFCGELLEENRYDKHIAEHNKVRTQRRVSAVAHVEEYDCDEFPLKCPVCFKGFKRKHYYNTHINKHIEEGIDVPEVPVSPNNDGLPNSQYHPDSEDESEDYTSDNDKSSMAEDDVQGQEIILEDNTKLYVCCGRSFKLKAHFFRHYKIKHPNNVRKRHPIRYADPANTVILPLPTTNDGELVRKPPPLVPIKKEIVGSDLTVLPADVKVKQEPGVESETNRKRSSGEIESDIAKRIKMENPEAVKLRNTVAAHLDDIEIVPVSPTISLKYECTYCEKRFRQRSQLRDHVNIHTGEKPYKCEFCHPVHGFTQSSSLYFHIRKVHTAIMKNVSWAIQSKNGLCLICLEVFERHTSMYMHLRQNYVENGFDCEMCAKNVTMTCHYKVHNIDPNDMDSFMLPQQNLEVLLTEDAESSRASSVDETVDEGVNEAEAIMSKARRCEPCGKMFKSLQYYNMHTRGLLHKQREQAHKNMNRAYSEETISVNTETHEIKTEPIDIETNEIEEMEIDENKKTQRFGGTFECPTCQQTFRTKTLLRKHRRVVHHTAYLLHQKRLPDTDNSELDETNESETDLVKETVESGDTEAVNGEIAGKTVETDGDLMETERPSDIESKHEAELTEETETDLEHMNGVTSDDLKQPNEVANTENLNQTDTVETNDLTEANVQETNEISDTVETNHLKQIETEMDVQETNEIGDTVETNDLKQTETNVQETNEIAETSKTDDLKQIDTETFEITDTVETNDSNQTEKDFDLDTSGTLDLPIELRLSPIDPDLPDDIVVPDADLLFANEPERPEFSYKTAVPVPETCPAQIFDYYVESPPPKKDFSELFGKSDPELNPEQELLALLHDAGAYETKQNELADVGAAAGSKILSDDKSDSIEQNHTDFR